MNGLYFTGFLNPRAWQSGDYRGAWALFAKEAVDKARKDEDTLTLGPTAGTAYSSVTAGPSTLFIRVLLSKTGQASTAVAVVRFTATATTQDGASSSITSTGDFFLQPTRRGWSISGYDVHRSGKSAP
jgi:hypothetical protein